MGETLYSRGERTSLQAPNIFSRVPMCCASRFQEWRLRLLVLYLSSTCRMYTGMIDYYLTHLWPAVVTLPAAGRTSSQIPSRRPG